MPKKALSYADMQQELSDIISWFESDDFELNEAIAKYEMAQKLAGNIENYLNTAANKIAKLKTVGE